MPELTSYLPDFIIVGAAKSGTTSLHRYLSIHPEIFMPSLKELNFFHAYGQHKPPIWERSPEMPTNAEDYAFFFAEAQSNQIKGEASPSYLIYYKRTIANIKHFYKGRTEPKIIIILREPIDKIWSHFRFNRSLNLDPDKLSLNEAINVESERIKKLNYLPDVHYINNTQYFHQVKAYLENFEEVKVFLFDDLKQNPVKLISELQDFLGVKNNIPENLGQRFNKTKKTIVSSNKAVAWARKIGLATVPFPFKTYLKDKLFKRETMSKTVENKLAQIFKPEVEKLQILLNLDLSSWLSKYK